jgi:hypothetical protein
VSFFIATIIASKKLGKEKGHSSSGANFGAMLRLWNVICFVSQLQLHMPFLKKFILPSILLCFFSCTKQKNSHAIRDFRRSIQPFLVKMASQGVVMYHDSSEMTIFSNKELVQMSMSENPVLRATAFAQMLNRKSFDRVAVAMDHLDDTATVATDAGEFGIWFQTVSDYILDEGRWTNAEFEKIIDRVLTKNNYLRFAYRMLDRVEPQEKYYPYIKNMATRPRRITPDGYELGFDDIEYALYGLAQFKKKKDINIIKDKMLKYVWKLSDISFSLMEMFPDTAYFEVLQTYHRRQFYNFSGYRPHGFTGYPADRAAPEDFIKALVVQKTSNSANLLDSMLNRLELQTCMPDRENIITEIIMQIWKHPCTAYERLRAKIKSRALKISRWSTPIEVDTIKVSR